jgi:hypothetical protein
MKTPSILKLAVIAILLLIFPVIARAEIAVGESIEWIVPNSDRIVAATVTKLETTPDANKNPCQVVTVTVSKTFKGEASDQVVFVLPPGVPAEYAAHWLDEKTSILFCLVKNDGKRIALSTDKFPWVLRASDGRLNATLLGRSKHETTGCHPLYTSEFKIVTQPAAVTALIEQTVKTAKQTPLPSILLDAPFGGVDVDDDLYAGSTVYLIVPVDEKLEPRAQAWCKSKFPGERQQGARILSRFKSDINIALLTALLDDPYSFESTSTRTTGENTTELLWRKKIYPVRQIAFKSLTKLGANPKPPVMEELLEGKDDKKEKRFSIWDDMLEVKDTRPQ